VIVLSTDGIWFSHREEIWSVDTGKFHWTGDKRVWDFDSCTFELARTLRENKLRVVVRSKNDICSKYMGGKLVRLRYMLGFDVTRVSEPHSEPYTARRYDPDKKDGPKERWVFQLDDEYWIWQWAHEGGDIRSSAIHRLFERLKDEISNPSLTSHNIFEVDEESEGDALIPVIYQPAVDGLKNFVREVHCAELPSRPDGAREVEVSIMFNNEQLREHAIANELYELFRLFFWGRTIDIETFKILIPKDIGENSYVFERIYSGDAQLFVDDKHGDPPIAPERRIKYYLVNNNHPVVFVNTSNHAMAERDTNHRIWKWEYVPWVKNAPIRRGCKTRKEIDKEFKPFWKFW
jgi:hypothetical protein